LLSCLAGESLVPGYACLALGRPLAPTAAAGRLGEEAIPGHPLAHPGQGFLHHPPSFWPPLTEFGSERALMLIRHTDDDGALVQFSVGYDRRFDPAAWGDRKTSIELVRQAARQCR